MGYCEKQVKEISFAGHSVILSSSESEVFSILEQELSPFFSILDVANDLNTPLARVFYVEDLSTTNLPSGGDGEEILLHTGSHQDDLRLGRRYKLENGTILIDSYTTGSLIYVCESGRRIFVHNPDVRNGARDVRRVIRDQLFFAKLLAENVEIFHASAIADTDGNATLFLALSGGGKTTAFMAAMCNAHLFRFLSAERVLVRKEGFGLYAFASPESITIMRGMLNYFPQTRSHHNDCDESHALWDKKTKKRLQWKDLFGAFAAEPQIMPSKVRRIVHIQYDKKIDLECSSVPVKDRHDILYNCRLGAYDKNRPDWIGAFPAPVENNETIDLVCSLDFKSVRWSSVEALSDWILKNCIGD